VNIDVLIHSFKTAEMLRQIVRSVNWTGNRAVVWSKMGFSQTYVCVPASTRYNYRGNSCNHFRI